MKVQLTKAARIWHNAGEIVEVSPAEADFLQSVGAAIAAAEKPAPEKPKAKKGTK